MGYIPNPLVTKLFIFTSDSYPSIHSYAHIDIFFHVGHEALEEWKLHVWVWGLAKKANLKESLNVIDICNSKLLMFQGQEIHEINCRYK